MIREYKGKKPEISDDSMIFDSAEIMGDVKIGKRANIFPFAVLRGDILPIRVGDNCSIQENCVLHTTTKDSVTVGDDVTLGHGAILHGCKIGNNVVVGMNAVVLNGAIVGDDSIVGAGAVVTENHEFPPRSLILGIPGKRVRELGEEDIQKIKHHTDENQKLLDGWKDEL